MGAPIPVLFIHDVVAKTTTYNSGSGTFTVPNYNVLAIQTWGGGGAGYYSGGQTAGGNTTASFTGVSISAQGGQEAVNKSTNGVGGGSSGNNGSNTAGGNGTFGQNGSNNGFSRGGSSPNGGTGGYNVGSSDDPPTAPGAGSGGYIGAGNIGYPAGGGGGYGYSSWNPSTLNAPAPGTTIAWHVGAGGTSPGSPDFQGAAGRIQFTVT